MFPAAGLVVHQVPGQPDHVDEEALGEPVLAQHRLRHSLALLGEGDRPSRTLDVAIRGQPVEHFGDRRRRPPEPLGDTGLNGRRSLLVQRLDRLEVLLHRRVVFDRMVGDARVLRRQSRICWAR